MTWFVVLYHGTDALERFTYREIEQLLRDIGASHNGRNGESTYYNNTSINRLLVVLGWESFEHTDHTSVGKNVRSKRISIA